MPLTTEFIESQKLTPEQVTAIGEVFNNDIAEVKKTYDGKANTDAEAILEGAAKAVETKTGIVREKGQKIADYITFAGEKFVEGKLSSETEKVNRKQKEYEQLIKDGASDGALKKKYDELQAAHDDLQKKEAEFDRVKPFEDLYTNLSKEHLTLKQTTAFSMVKPAFPDTVNKYEAEAKWNAFVKDVQNSHDIEIVDEIPMAISKENKHKTVKLSDLVAKNAEIQALTQGRAVKGTGADPTKEMGRVKGVPFDVPVKSTPEERQKLITEYLLEFGKKADGSKLTRIDPEWATKFSEYNRLLLEGTPATT
ncbi:MAG: hypothetical protein M0Q91_18260 [Methanoregula sp.]|jgi:hypothetical protein|nr:hypothetical protein [Methanoregula sp.]